ncbi:aminoglycoside phosphotransferase family protein [Streptomyces sp. H51]|uniref:aminoglycoside phosphotransferase family protein n=1 Tax=Streptomyces sp. H51 TaxID=3111770 RepID=UPI002D76E09B|nr:aminoglycoside phosphotransferase family protein [Streptomyces sp. H51]
MTISARASSAVLATACSAAGLDPSAAEPIRIAENEIWRLPGERAIARIARPGQLAAATREVRVAQWLADNGVPAVRAMSIAQPVDVCGRPVTFWEELPTHTNGTVRDVVQLLKRIHPLPVPDFALGELDPFVRVPERIDAATSLTEEERSWLRQRHEDLQGQWVQRPAGLPDCVVHGDAWVGNVARTAAGPILLDFERVSVGPPEWDLVSTAVKLTTTGAVSRPEYAEFCDLYGLDVTQWEGYELFSGARELRMATYAAQHAATRPEWQEEAQYRVDCLRGRRGPRPWKWTGIM